MKHVTILRGLSLATLVVISAACSSSPDEGIGDITGPGLGETIVYADATFDVVDTDEAGIPNFLSGRVGEVRLAAGMRQADVERAMFPILAKAAPMLRMKPEEMLLSRGHADAQGDSHFRFQQYRNGLEVIGGELVVHVRNGVVFAVNGSARGDYEADVDTTIDEDGATNAAKRWKADVEGLQIDADMPLAYRVAGERLELVYKVDVTGVGKDQTPIHDTLLVSARDGAIIATMPHIHTAKNRALYDLKGGTALPGTLARSEGGAAVADAIVNNNYDRLGTVYDCYKTLFNRDSYNNAGAQLKSSVHYSTNYVNAYWNGTQMVYGDGDNVTASNLANSLDVTGHELTHAVTSSTSNLTYSGESGGLNESMSDIFGNVCEWFGAGKPAIVPSNTWLVGEDVWTPGTANDALRYMNDPVRDGSSLDYWTSTAGSVDVHYNSGISNLAFYLLAKGGTHPRGKSTTNVVGIGIEKAAQIFYKANVGYMTASTNFAGAKTATEQAATALGYSTTEVASVTAAWQAVGVGGGGGGGGGTTCSHDKCSTGTALVSTCNSVVTSVCGSDPYCCTTSWDSQCVTEGRTIGKSLKCAEANGTCAHNLCTSGSKLTNSCDSAKANCVATVCAYDAYCCNTGWDSICVGYVASKCAKNCN